MFRRLHYFLSQAGPLHPKHGGGQLTSRSLHKSSVIPPLHPALAFVVHYYVSVLSIFFVHDFSFAVQTDSSLDHRLDRDIISQRQDRITPFTLAYIIILFGVRYLSSTREGQLRQHAVLYEFTWMCNSTLLIGFISFGGLGNIFNFTNRDILSKFHVLGWICKRRPLVVTACCVGVSIDQFLWYVDLIGRAVTGKFPVGVAKYLTWKQTLWIDCFTCTHHLWTLPLFIYGAGELSVNSFILSVYVVVIQVLLSRWLTPHQILLVPDHHQGDIIADPKRHRYLNVNLSHELWRDISIPILQISSDAPPCWIYFSRLFWRWQLFNFLVYVAILNPLSEYINTRQHELL